MNEIFLFVFKLIKIRKSTTIELDKTLTEFVAIIPQ